MLTKNDKADLRWAMQAALLEQSKVLTENKSVVKDFVLAEATYEQLLNLCFNPHNSNEVYLESEVLEAYAKEIILDMVGYTAEEQHDLTTIKGKFDLLESVVAETFSPDAVKNMTAPKDGYKYPKSAMAKAKLRQAGRYVAGKASAAGKYAKDKGQAAIDLAKRNPKTAGAIGATALAAAGYYVYRKARKAGKSKEQAAQMAAAAAKTPAEKAKFQKMAKGGK